MLIWVDMDFGSPTLFHHFNFKVVVAAVERCEEEAEAWALATAPGSTLWVGVEDRGLLDRWVVPAQWTAPQSRWRSG